MSLPRFFIERKKTSVFVSSPESGKCIKLHVQETLGLEESAFYLLRNGRIVGDGDIVTGDVQFVLRVCGGKGGFGSMLRAIGAQIEKTTNREACRDLSGRRLRDINEEKRLKNWIATKADREREAVERKKKKLERLCAEPKHDFKDQNYEKERAELTDKVSDAVDQGCRASAASSSGINQKRRKTQATSTKSKKSRLWIDADEEDISSSTDSDDSTCDKPTSSASTIDLIKPTEPIATTAFEEKP